MHDPVCVLQLQPINNQQVFLFCEQVYVSYPDSETELRTEVGVCWIGRDYWLERTLGTC